MTAATVTEIWRFPVKSLLGERVEEADVSTVGIAGDRAWGVVDLGTGYTLTARREPKLLYASARMSDGTVVVTLPDGTETADGRALSAWLGRDVELRPAGREVRGTFEISLAEDEQTDWVHWEGGFGSFHDSGSRTISVVAAASARNWDLRRFRLNVVTDGPAGSETELLGGQVALGSCIVDMGRPVDRCVMVTRPQPDGIERDLSVLKTITAELGGNLGVGGTVAVPGRIAVGDAVRRL